MIGLGDLYSGALGATDTIDNFILVSPDFNTGIQTSDENKTNSAGFLFHVIGEESLNYQADITDHYVEDNATMQDHIAQKPLTILLSGYISELNNVVPVELRTLKNIANKLELLGAYTPTITATALRAYNTADQVYRAYKKTEDAYKTAIGGKGAVTKQAKAWNEFDTYFKNRTLFYVQTPWAKFKNMAIQTMRIVQSDTDKNSTDFEITFKQIRRASILLGNKKITKARGASTVVSKGPNVTSPFIQGV